MRRRLWGCILVAVVILLVTADPAHAHCTFSLDRSQTTAGGEFYGIGDPFLVGERVTIRWLPSNIVLDEFVVTGTREGYGYFNRRLIAPSTAEPGPYIVAADVQPNTGAPYRLTQPIEVVAPSSAAPAASDPAEPAPPRGSTREETASLPPPAPPTRAHQPIRPEPVRVAQPSLAVQPARVPVRSAVPAAQPQPQPRTAEAGQPVPAPVSEPVPAGRAQGSEGVAAPATSSGTLTPVLATAAGPGALVVLAVAFASLMALTRKRRLLPAV